MTDLNKLRSEFESNEYIKSIIQNFEWSEKFNNYQIKDCVVNGNIFDLLEAKNDEQLLNGAWFGWQEKAKAQAVPEGYVVVPKDVAERTIGHIGIAIYHPNNTRDEENIMSEDQVVIERAIEASESGAEG
ncbi:AB1gp37 [Acinetobacter phage AB1]|uniref:AB1gp37 n=1 Tax=Acinetobacter phage AB1 TaxID=889876 RepID=E2GLX5_9CAUD|nr:AB1gp37 [Acinetobacter phage AB1]ADO14408.1 AB1gp37 [Acinetobacter phage AB1]